MHKSLPPKIIKDSTDLSIITLNRDNIKIRRNSINNNSIPADIANKAAEFNSRRKVETLDIVRENRQAKVLSLYSKGLNQEQIAQELNIDQSTVSRDLQLIKQEATRQIEKYLREDILSEYLRYIIGSNEITRKLWDIVQDKDAKTKEMTNALSVLMQVYNSRLQTLTTGPESYMNIQRKADQHTFGIIMDTKNNTTTF